MKKLILSVVAMASLALAANAQTYYMRVQTSEGQVDFYDAEKVVKVDYRGEKYANVTVSGTLDNYDYVDLGLSVKWATYNVGATKIEEFGDYFAWGETSPKDEYNWSTYKWCENKIVEDGVPRDFTKYCCDSVWGEVDGLKRLEAADDAATSNWGGKWRMPTPNELYDLVNGCVWEWISDFHDCEIPGYLGTSKKNGNTIFLPAAGMKGYPHYDDLYYWSADIWSPEYNYVLYLDGGNKVFHSKLPRLCTFYERALGFTVRAVCP